MPIDYNHAGGVRTFYGPRPSPATNPESVAATESTYGSTKEVLLRWNFDNVPNPSAASSLDATELVIPANAFIESARLFVENAFVGGTSIAVDLRNPADGTVYSANGLVTATQGATANLTAKAWIVGSGSNVAASVGAGGAVPVGNSPYPSPFGVKLGVTVVGTFTAGRGGVIVRYLEPTA